MPNKNCNAGHKAVRTCVICKNRSLKEILLNFYMLNGRDIVFDIRNRVQTRKLYICHENECLIRLDKWLAKYRKKQKMAIAGR